MALEIGFTNPEFLGDGADELRLDFDDELFDWLLLHAVDFFVDDFGAAGFELEAFAAHGLDENRKMKLAAAGDFVAEAVGDDFQGDVRLKLALEAFGDLAGGRKLAFLAFQRGGVRADIDTQGRRLELNGRESFGSLAVLTNRGDSVADVGLGDAGNSDNVASFGFFGFFFAETFVGEDAVDFRAGGFQFASLDVSMEDFDGFAFFQAAAEDFANGVFAEIIIGSESGDKELGTFIGGFVDFRGGNVIDNRVENDMEIVVEVGR